MSEARDKETQQIAPGLKTLRSKLGATQKGMAMRLDVPESVYNRWENGRRVPEGTTLLKILKLCPDLDSLRAFGVMANVKRLL